MFLYPVYHSIVGSFWLQGIVREMTKKNKVTLSDSQINQLLSQNSSENPLWLTVACEELCTIDSSEKVDNRIKCLPDGILK